MKCVKCGRTMVVRTGKNGKFYGCPGFPQCKSTAPYKEVRTPQVRVQRDWSELQLNVFDAVGRSEDNLIIEAVAGGAKTTVGIESLYYATRYQRIAYVAFNRSIAQDFKSKVPEGVHASTYHALGLKSIMQARGNEVKVEETKNFKLFAKFTDSLADTFKSTATDYRSEILRLVGLAKNVMLDVTGTESFRNLADEYGIDIGDDSESGLVLDITHKVYKASVEDNYTIDFDDMIYWCATGRVEPLAFDFVVTDECLPYKTPILLSDGTSMTIGEMVDSRFDGEVLTYNEFTGVQESKKVIGWHKIANQKQLYKVKVKWSKKVGTNFSTNFVVCTEDHKIYTSRGWVRADNLMIGDVVQVETSAKKSQAYKITSTGRDSLAMVMSGKNASGLMKSNHKNGSIVQRGGNGRGFTVPQSMLLEELGDGWVGEFAIKTSGWYRGCQYPPCYKVDIANPDKMVAVEVDGHSHNRPEIKSKDDKKRSLLESLGWTVIHVKNVDAVQKTKEVAKSILDVFDCPIDAIVTEIEPVNIPDFFVYDITVEDNHNFYANGILVHNCQDMNGARIAMLLRMLRNGGRSMVVGDRKQAIYQWAGSSEGAMDIIKHATNARELPLSITYRCPASHVKLAQELVPQIQARPNAPEGIIGYLKPWQLTNFLRDGDMVMCRTNAPLVRPAFEMLAQGKKAIIVGRDIGSNMVNLIDRIAKKNSISDTNSMLDELTKYIDMQVYRLEKTGKLGKAAMLRDQLETIEAIADGCPTVDSVNRKITDIFSDDKAGVRFSSCHRSKGLEAERTFILRPELMPHPMAQGQQAMESEKNVQYVCYTRSKSEMYFVV